MHTCKRIVTGECRSEHNNNDTQDIERKGVFHEEKKSFENQRISYKLKCICNQYIFLFSFKEFKIF